MAGKIVDLCVRCRFLNKKLEGQKMAALPPCLTVPGPPFLQGLGGSERSRVSQRKVDEPKVKDNQNRWERLSSNNNKTY